MNRNQSGANRPPIGYEYTHGDRVHGDKFGGDKVEGNKYVGAAATQAAPQTAQRDSRPVVLLLTANPDGTSPLRLDEERRAIDHAVAGAPGGDRLDLRSADALRLDDLHTALLRHRPAVAHFSGHGSGPGGLVVLGEYGQPQRVPPTALSRLFEIIGESLRCVVLNACFTDDQAAAIGRYVPCVVGMNDRVDDRAAIRFAVAFYRAVAFGHSVRTAYDLGCNALELVGHRDATTPVLLARPGVAEQTVIAA